MIRACGHSAHIYDSIMSTDLPETLKFLRQARGLTLATLAARSDVSRAMISKIERDEAVPTTTVLGRLAEALEVSISQLLNGVRAAEVRLSSANAQPVFVEPGTGFTRRSLSPNVQDRGVDFVLNTMPAGSRTGPFPAHRPGVAEQLFLHSGQLIVRLGNVDHHMCAGDCLYYPAQEDHSFINPGPADAVFFIVIDNTGI
jgi:transcriptional regulator with XRE-family HTH domain